MPLFCSLGLHRWIGKASARPGTTVYRCQWCNDAIVKHRGRRRQYKRFWFLGCAAVSLLAWYVIIALGLTGHTKVLWGAKKIEHGVNHQISKADRKVRQVVGAPQVPKNP